MERRPFDYFDDRRFDLLLRRLIAMVKPGAEVVVGNFDAEDNPSAVALEVCCDWVLIHRSADALLGRAAACGVGADRARVECEPEGINLFLRVRR